MRKDRVMTGAAREVVICESSIVPGELELEFVFTVGYLVCDGDRGIRGDGKPVPGDLDSERLTGLDGLCGAPQEGGEVRSVGDLLDISFHRRTGVEG